MFTFQFLNDKIHKYVKKNIVVKAEISSLLTLVQLSIYYRAVGSN